MGSLLSYASDPGRRAGKLRRLETKQTLVRLNGALCITHGGAACHQHFGLKAAGTLCWLAVSLFSGLVGPLIDKYGRRLGCVIYCLLEIAINLMEDVADMRVLLLGRFLGGISTSLLFVSFESWMVTEHRRRGFPESLLASTFSYAQVGNGLLAVAAGFLNQRVSDAYGPIGSFRLAVAVTLVVLMGVLTTWNENYGNAKATLGSGFSQAWNVIFDPTDRTVLFIGISQSLFEGGMYTFVFNWVPALRAASGENVDMPQGLVFSCLMICVTIGGLLTDSLWVLALRAEIAHHASTFLSPMSFWALLLLEMSFNFLLCLPAFSSLK